MTRSGTLLLGWIDPSGTLAALRQQLGLAFPGASSKQSNIIHTSLLRIITTPQQQQQQLAAAVAAGGSSDPRVQQLPAAVVTALSELCEGLTQRYRGLQLRVCQLHWVVEKQFSTVQGQQLPVLLCT